ncbi:MAG: cupredoxin domain-containing protein [Chloroflexi bacterium]|nr:cupredoxin domain-containing protein [Chloroflexota bacterium]
MKAWIGVLLLVILVAGAMAYVALDMARAPEATAARVAEFAPGLKRAPGTFQERSINVGAALETLGEPDVTIDIIAVRPAFLPNEIRVKQGQVVRLRLNGRDNGLADMPGVDEAVGLNEFSGHGFQLLGPYDVWVTGIRKGVTREVTFKATEVGEFAFECVVFCHPNHYMMQGKLIVEKP